MEPRVTIHEPLVDGPPPAWRSTMRKTVSARRRSEDDFWALGESKRYFGSHMQGNLSVRRIREEEGNKMLRLALVLTIMYWVAGSLFYCITVGWGVTDSSYFLITSSLTIGYGDLVVSTDMQRCVTAFLLLIGIGGVGASVGYAFSFLFGEDHLQKMVDKYRTEAYNRGVDPSPEFEFELKKQRARLECAYGLAAFITLTLFGMICFTWLEGVSFSTSFYWAIVTAATVGYGDVVPTTPEGKWFTIFWAATTSFVLVYALGNLGTYPYRIRDWTNEKRVLLQYGENMTEGQLRTLVQGVETVLGPATDTEDGEPRKGITRAEFVLTMLVLLDRISVVDYRECKMAFDKLDDHGKGVLLLRDMNTLGQRAEEVRQQIQALHEQRLAEDRERHGTGTGTWSSADVSDAAAATTGGPSPSSRGTSGRQSPVGPPGPLGGSNAPAQLHGGGSSNSGARGLASGGSSAGGGDGNAASLSKV